MKCEHIRGPFDPINITDIFATTDESNGKPVKVKSIDIDLLPCPFCGGEAKFVIKGPYQSYRPNDFYCIYLVACKECGAQSDVNFVNTSSMDFSKLGEGYFDVDYFLPSKHLWNARVMGTKGKKGSK